MSNDLDDFKTMFDAATPQPDATRRAENFALARKNFEDLHGAQARPGIAPHMRGRLWRGFQSIVAGLTGRTGLATTTAAVAAGFLLVTPQLQDSVAVPPAPQITTLDFDGAVTAPQIERGPMLSDDMSPDLLQREPLTQPFGEVLRGPVRESFAPEAEQQNDFAPDFSNRSTADEAMPFAANSAESALQADDAEVFASTASPHASSYALVRAALMRGELPAPDVVDVAEMVSHFSAPDAVNDANLSAVQLIITSIQAPWNAETLLVHIALIAQPKDEDVMAGLRSNASFAGDVDMQITFDPDLVTSHRRIGDAMPRPNEAGQSSTAFAFDRLDAGQTISLLFEATSDREKSDRLGQITLRYQLAGDDQIRTTETSIPAPPPANTETNFAAAIVAFAQLLRGDDHPGGWTYNQMIAFAEANRGADPFGQSAEAVGLMRLARELSE
ncbi:von Willebrand factor type A domain-containing protein [Cognatiyoonia sp. IB215446]|uniref:YfbK domain-containing protein n=1 Tax=Cognatiyoonia sp. IB215446 TaxID=3097355 RepID=UPI002A0FA7C8|nr:von Willebrand factor type A domain-containing protein [Cognatiyoonia sp. IB215446]MDX8347174.1 von Willebrand factor type A domain-containing protein [Cognatiyoonia sp. IB215446]